MNTRCREPPCLDFLTGVREIVTASDALTGSCPAACVVPRSVMRSTRDRHERRDRLKRVLGQSDFVCMLIYVHAMECILLVVPAA